MRFSILTLAVAVLAFTGCGQEDETSNAPAMAGLILVRESLGSTVVASCFREGPAPAPSTACTTSTFGGCEVTECLFAQQPSGVAPVSNVFTDSAGIISVDGVLEDGSPGRALGPFKGSSGSFAPGATLTVSAPGNRVPAFTQTIRMPGPVALTSPDCGFRCESIRSDVPLTLEWTGDAEATVLVGLNTSHTENGVSHVLQAQCVAGKSPMTLPAELLTRFASVGDNGYSIGIGTLHQQRFIAGEYDILLEASGASSGFVFVRPPARK